MPKARLPGCCFIQYCILSFYWIYFSFSKYLLLMLNSEASCFCAGKKTTELVLQLANIFSWKAIKSIPYPLKSFFLQKCEFFFQELSKHIFWLINCLSALSKWHSIIPKWKTWKTQESPPKANECHANKKFLHSPFLMKDFAWNRNLTTKKNMEDVDLVKLCSFLRFLPTLSPLNPLQ